MVRNISDAIEIEKNKDFNRPIELYEFYLDDFTIYRAMYPKDLTHDGETYTASALSRTALKKDIELKANRIDIHIDNVSKDMSAYINHFEFTGKKVVIKKAFLNEDEEVIDTLTIFTGFMDEPAVDEYNAEITATGKLDLLKKDIPARKFGISCPWTFGDPDTCGVEISEVNNTKRNGQVEDTDGEFRVYLSEITGDDEDYWAYGYIDVKYGVEGHEAVTSRFVTSSGTEEINGTDTGYVDIDVPFFINIDGEDYELTAGCDKTFGGEFDDPEEGEIEIGHGCKFWDNEQFFGGFRSIPEAREIPS